VNKKLKLAVIIVALAVVLAVVAHHLPGFEAIVRKVHGG